MILTLDTPVKTTWWFSTIVEATAIKQELEALGDVVTINHSTIALGTELILKTTIRRCWALHGRTRNHGIGYVKYWLNRQYRPIVDLEEQLSDLYDQVNP